MKKENLSKSMTGITILAKVAQTLNFVDFAGRYKWAISKTDLDIAKKVELTGIKKY